MKQTHTVIGVDLGATNVRAARVGNGSICSPILSKKISSQGSVAEVLEEIFDLIGQLILPEVQAIGIGVPSVVDVREGIVYDVQYIPSWKEVPLKASLQKRFGLPTWVNNDANCFALGEFYFGKGMGADSMIGLTLGTGMGAGIILEKRLYAGPNCGAGEFGMVDYLDHVYEYYCSGQFFSNVYQRDGQEIYRLAQAGDATAQQMYAQMGKHLGNAIKLILYTYDPTLIVFGGSVRHAYEFFQKAMWERIQTFAFTRSLEKLRIELSDLENSGILGAAALYYDAP